MHSRAKFNRKFQHATHAQTLHAETKALTVVVGYPPCINIYSEDCYCHNTVSLKY